MKEEEEEICSVKYIKTCICGDLFFSFKNKKNERKERKEGNVAEIKHSSILVVSKDV